MLCFMRPSGAFLVVAATLAIAAPLLGDQSKPGQEVCGNITVAKNRNEDSDTSSYIKKMIQLPDGANDPQIWYFVFPGHVPLNDFKTPEIPIKEPYKINLEKWQNYKKQDSARYYFLRNFFYSNKKLKSESGFRHASCFTGDGVDVAYGFFGCDPKSKIANIENLQVTVSRDHFMIGIQYHDKKVKGGADRHFRLPSCMSGGKNSLFSLAETGLKGDADNLKKPVAPAQIEEETLREPAAASPLAPQTNADGFKNLDILSASDAVTYKNLPKFSLNGKYESAPEPETEVLPWRELTKDDKFNITNPIDANKLLLVVQNYIYEGMFDQDKTGKNPDNNFYVENSKRYWCHMPWLNVGPNGREALHGLTQERPLNPSKIYPNINPGNDLGVAVYNSIGCKTINNIFGSSTHPNKTPDFSRSKFEDGTLTAKILFTTAVFDDLHLSDPDGAFTWHANAAEPGNTSRSVIFVHHIQMDVAIKDLALVNPSSADEATRESLGGASNWMMLTYYYDKSYNPGPSTLPGNYPPGILHMRPAGLQAGFDLKGTMLVGQTNQNNGRLNGPADNPASSCIGCHGSAGTKINMVPGVNSADQWKTVVRAALDFSQQVNLAERNYETRPK